jgi:hypothetical protein
MKKLPLLFITSLSLLIMSCGSDPISESIIGSTWQLRSIEQTGCDDPDENIDFTTVNANNCLEVDNDLVCNFTFQFAANGQATLQASYDGEVELEELTYTTNDDIDEVTICGGSSIPDCVIGTVDGNEMTLSLSDGGGCMGFFIVEKS